MSRSLFTRIRPALWVAVLGFSAAALVSTADAGQPRDCQVFSQARNTEYNVLHVCNQAQLDRLFASLPAGPMPVYGATAQTHWRVYPDGRDADFYANKVVDTLAGQAKVFYTHRSGGTAVDRVAGGLSLTSDVRYGRASGDGDRAIIENYGVGSAAVVREEIRRLQPGLYLGSAWIGSTPAHDGVRATFVLDFTN